MAGSSSSSVAPLVLSQSESTSPPLAQGGGIYPSLPPPAATALDDGVCKQASQHVTPVHVTPVQAVHATPVQAVHVTPMHAVHVAPVQAARVVEGEPVQGYPQGLPVGAPPGGAIIKERRASAKRIQH
ncbi:MAG: hypothetical protein SGPRY_010322 [Prymnesium sp.]